MNEVKCMVTIDLNERDFHFEKGSTYQIESETDDQIFIKEEDGYLGFSKDKNSSHYYGYIFKIT